MTSIVTKAEVYGFISAAAIFGTLALGALGWLVADYFRTRKRVRERLDTVVNARFRR